MRLTKKRSKIITKALNFTVFRLIIDQCAADLLNFQILENLWACCEICFRARNIVQKKMEFVILIKMQLFHTSFHIMVNKIIIPDSKGN